jgi:predicted dehydrogenase
MEFYGTRGSMRIGYRGEQFTAANTDHDWTPVAVDLGRQLKGLPDTGFAGAFVGFAPHIIRAMQNGNSTVDGAATFGDGLEVQRVLDAARESHRSRCAVTIE